MFKLTILLKAAGLICALLAVTGCSATHSNHGFVPPEAELAELIEGVDTRATVDDAIGPPTAGGVQAGGDYYYIRSRQRTFGMFRPEIVERQIVAISFDETDTIRNIERFALDDGKVVALSQRVTDSSVVGNGFWRQIIGNIGNFSPADVL